MANAYCLPYEQINSPGSLVRDPLTSSARVIDSFKILQTSRNFVYAAIAHYHSLIVEPVITLRIS
jgi:hypothetical protein